MDSQTDRIARKGRRLAVDLPSRLLHSGTNEVAAAISNISFYGFRAVSAAPVERGDFISIALPSVGLVRAKVAWTQTGSFGAMFLRPVDVRTFLQPSLVTSAA